MPPVKKHPGSVDPLPGLRGKKGAPAKSTQITRASIAPRKWALGLTAGQLVNLRMSALNKLQIRKILGLSPEEYENLKTAMQFYYQTEDIRSKTQATAARKWDDVIEYCLSQPMVTRLRNQYAQQDEEGRYLRGTINTMLIDFAKSKGKEPQIPIKEEHGSDDELMGATPEFPEVVKTEEEEDDEVTGLIHRNLSTYVGRPVQISMWWPQSWRKVPVKPPAPGPEEEQEEDVDTMGSLLAGGMTGGEAKKHLADATTSGTNAQARVMQQAIEDHAPIIAAMPDYPVHHVTPYMPSWLALGQDGEGPFITHAQLMLPTFNHILQTIRRQTPAFCVEEGEWVPRQIFGATNTPREWKGTEETLGAHPDPADIVTIEDDEDVRLWMAASAHTTLLRMCVVFHQVDAGGDQTPTGLFRNYLPPETYRRMEEEEEELAGDDPTGPESSATAEARAAHTPVRPTPVAGLAIRSGLGS